MGSIKLEKQAKFTEVEHFPGTTGNPFDTILHRLVELEKLPAPVFGAVLLLAAMLFARLNWFYGLGLWAFFLLDWALLAGLPSAGKSFGPAKPTVLILMIARGVLALVPFPLWLEAALQVIGTALVVYGFWIEPHRLTVTRQRLVSPKLPRGTKVRALHLGDLHLERITGRERQLNRLIDELKPDLILFSGDFLNLSYLHDPVAWEGAREILREWKAPLGVFAVTGSPAVDLGDNVPALLNGMDNICWLKDQEVSIPIAGGAMDVVGLTCTHKPFIDGPTLETAAGRQPKNFTIFLYHTPDLAPEAAEMGIDLQLSGHTHGGQVRLPFYGALFAGSLYGKRFEAGRYQVGEMTLYVTRGIGMEGQAAPRVRFLCPPEIILWDLEGSE